MLTENDFNIYFFKSFCPKLVELDLHYLPISHWDLIVVGTSAEMWIPLRGSWCAVKLCVCVKLYLCEKDKALVMQGAVIHSVTSRACSLCECVCVKMCHQSLAYVWWWSYPPDDPLNQMVCDCMPVRVCVCVSHLWASWHSSQSPHPPVLQRHTPHFPPSFILSVGCDHIKAKKGGLQVCAPKEASISLTVTLSRSRSRSLSLSFLPLSQWGPCNPYGVRRSGDRVMDNPLGHI